MMLSHILDYNCIFDYTYISYQMANEEKWRYIIPFSSLSLGWGVVTKSHSNKRLAVQWNAWSRSSGSRCLFGLYPHASWQAVSKDCRRGHSPERFAELHIRVSTFAGTWKNMFLLRLFRAEASRVNIELGKKLLKGQLSAISFIKSVTFSDPMLCRRRVRNNMDVAIWINLGKIFKMFQIDRNDTSHTSSSSNLGRETESDELFRVVCEVWLIDTYELE